MKSKKHQPTKRKTELNLLLENVWNIVNLNNEAEPDPYLKFTEIININGASASADQLLEFISMDLNAEEHARFYFEHAFNLGHEDLIPHLLDLFFDVLEKNKIFYLKLLLQNKVATATKSKLMLDYFSDMDSIAKSNPEEFNQIIKLVCSHKEQTEIDCVAFFNNLTDNNIVSFSTIMNQICDCANISDQAFNYVIDNLDQCEMKYVYEMLRKESAPQDQTRGIKLINALEQRPNFETELIENIFVIIGESPSVFGSVLFKYVAERHPDYDLHKLFDLPKQLWRNFRGLLVVSIFGVLGENLNAEPFAEDFVRWAIQEVGFGYRDKVQILREKMFEHSKKYFHLVPKEKFTKYVVDNCSTVLMEQAESLVNYIDMSAFLIIYDIVDTDFMRFILENGADPNYQDGIIMYNAIICSNYEILTLLIEYGGDLNLVRIIYQNDDFLTKHNLHQASFSTRNDFELKYINFKPCFVAAAKHYLEEILIYLETNNTTPTIDFFNRLRNEMFKSAVEKSGATNFEPNPEFSEGETSENNEFRREHGSLWNPEILFESYDAIPSSANFMNDLFDLMEKYDLILCDKIVRDDNEPVPFSLDFKIKFTKIVEVDGEFTKEMGDAEIFYNKIQWSEIPLSETIGQIFEIQINSDYQLDQTLSLIRIEPDISTPTPFGKSYRMHKYLPYFMNCVENSCGKIFLALYAVFERWYTADLLKALGEFPNKNLAEPYIKLVAHLEKNRFGKFLVGKFVKDKLTMYSGFKI
jgi:hypothetical protein